MPDEDLEKRVYLLEGLDCANCAAKIEAKIRQMPEVAYASVSYATKQLRVSADGQDALLPKMQAVIDSVEDGVTLVPRRRQVRGISRTKIYILQGLDCANCAAKIENAIARLEGVNAVSVTYATLQMKLSAKDPDALIPLIQQTVDDLEEGITILPKELPEAGEEKKARQSEADSMRRELVTILIGAAVFVAGVILEHTALPMPVSLAVFIAAYLLLGGQVLISAAKNIKKGQVFDENFLMCIATLGAFAIGEYPEAVGVMLFYRIGEHFQDRATQQSRSQIMDAVDMRPEVVNLLVGEQVQVIDAQQANVGDILLVRPGDRIPLDGVIIEGEGAIDTSPVTGEPAPVTVKAGDSVLSGCVNKTARLKLRVEKVLEESMVTRILDSVENAAASKPKIDRFITRFARVYTPVVVILALLVAFALPFVIPSWHFVVSDRFTASTVFSAPTGTGSVKTALMFLVISCPCALVLSVPLAFFSGIGASSKKGILFKGGLSIEALAGVRTVVLDKTGTITKGSFQVLSVVPLKDGMSGDELLSMAASCELSTSHPIGNSIIEEAWARGIDPRHPTRVHEISGMGIKAQTPEGAVLCGSRRLMTAEGVDISGCEDTVYGTEVLVAVNGALAGYIVIGDALKDDAGDAMGRIKKSGVTTVMLTGDSERSARAVAEQTGIDEYYAGLLPDEKLTELEKVRAEHGSVMFVGDGINDAPVLAGSDVGAAMGSGADAAIEAADVVFMTSEVGAIPASIDIAKTTRRISWQNVYFALGVKLIVMVLGLLGYANMWLAVLADTGVAMLCLLNSFRILRHKF
ncbi:MAG: heavy metal translocating P-type ATPase [Oscillospiraceae bacterium]|nr:heavy metal translocating P-type ATPase [Oscillospiraceae bacterium]